MSKIVSKVELVLPHFKRGVMHLRGKKLLPLTANAEAIKDKISIGTEDQNIKIYNCKGFASKDISIINSPDSRNKINSTSIKSVSKISPVKSISDHKGIKIVPMWSRVTRGIEWIAAAEAAANRNISNIRMGHRDLFYDSDLYQDTTLRCVDDTYVFWGKTDPIGHTRDEMRKIGRLISSLPDLPINIDSEVKNFRVTSSVLTDKNLNYSRYELENHAGQIISDTLGLKFLDSRCSDFLEEETIWFRMHFTKEGGIIGIKQSSIPLHRRSWRSKAVIGALHPPVATAMSILADLKPKQTVIDPFVGSGTTLIEAGLTEKDLNLFGFDTSKKALSVAVQNAELAEVPINFIKGNILSYQKIPTVDRVISNPPWERSVNLEGAKRIEYYIKKILSDILSNSGKMILVVDQEYNFKQRISKLGFNTQLVQPLRVSGRMAELIVVGESCFPDTEFGKTLDYYYNIRHSEQNF